MCICHFVLSIFRIYSKENLCQSIPFIRKTCIYYVAHNSIYGIFHSQLEIEDISCRKKSVLSLCQKSVLVRWKQIYFPIYICNLASSIESVSICFILSCSKCTLAVKNIMVVFASTIGSKFAVVILLESFLFSSLSHHCPCNYLAKGRWNIKMLSCRCVDKPSQIMMQMKMSTDKNIQKTLWKMILILYRNQPRHTGREKKRHRKKQRENHHLYCRFKHFWVEFVSFIFLYSGIICETLVWMYSVGMTWNCVFFLFLVACCKELCLKGHGEYSISFASQTCHLIVWVLCDSLFFCRWHSQPCCLQSDDGVRNSKVGDFHFSYLVEC